MRIMLENIPASLGHRQVALIKCLDAMTGAMPVRQVVLFGSYARGNARRDSDVDLCIIADGAKNQMKAARKFRRAIRDIRPKPAFTLVPISPERLQEKKESGDHFFATVLKEGICLAKEDGRQRTENSRWRAVISEESSNALKAQPAERRADVRQARRVAKTEKGT